MASLSAYASHRMPPPPPPPFCCTLARSALAQDATFRLNKGALTVDGSFITEVHFVAETGRGEGELVHATFWANELNDYNTGMNMITGFCGKRPFFLAAGKTRSCGNLVIQVKHSSATFTTPEWQSTVRGNQVYDRLWGAKHRLDVSLRAIDGRMVAPGQTHGAKVPLLSRSWICPRLRSLSPLACPTGLVGQSFSTPGPRNGNPLSAGRAWTGIDRSHF